MARPHRRPAAAIQLIATRPTRRRGIALVLVLWVLALLTVMALGVTATQRTEIALTDNLVANARFRAASDAAIAFMAVSYLMPAEDPMGTGADGETSPIPWIPDGSPRDWRFEGQALSISVTDERSRINLNLAAPTLLAALIQVFDVPDETATAIADAIADYRDEDDLRLLNGAEDDDYEAAGLPLGAKDESFVAVEELQQVLGMTKALYGRLAPELTVDSRGPRVEEAFASAAVIAALRGISMDEARLQVEERDDPLLEGAQGPAAVNRGGPLYRVRVESKGGGDESKGGGRIMVALVELMPGQTPPYLVRWRRFGLAGSPAPDATAEADDTGR